MQPPLLLAPTYEEETDAPRDLIAPSPDVFSYFLLTTPRERKNHNRFTVDAFTSYLLVIVVLGIQCILLYCVWHKVIGKNLNWQHGIMNTGHSWNVAGPSHAGCNDGKSLCTLDNGTFTCAPPSVQLIGRWPQLDTDGDGIWTQGEVMASREDLRCKFGVDPVEVFGVLGWLLKERAEHIWLHPDVRSGKAIHKEYFTYIMGDVAMCGYRNGDMCGNLVKRGFFDAALMQGNIPRVGTTIRSALDYCHSLLDPQGLCDRALPSKYEAWKIESAEECKEADFDEFIYEDPNTGAPKSLLAVDYKARKQYEVAQTAVFYIYKTCIVLIWMLLTVDQFRDALKTLAWVSQIPITNPDDPISARDVNVHEDVRTISTCHRTSLILVTLVRIGTVMVLLWIGLNFLARQMDYIGLLMDGVALIFIVEVEEIIYTRVIRQDVRAAWEDRKPIPLKKVGILAGKPELEDLIWFFVLLVFSVCFMWYYTASLVVPLYDALRCACLSEGESCREAHAFSYSFWQQYWLQEVPSAIQQIGRLKMKDMFSLVELEAAAPPATRSVGNLLRRGLQSRLAP